MLSASDMARRKVLRVCISIILLLIALGFSVSDAATEVLRPRGVPLPKAALYDASKPFSCFDGSNKVPFSYVNDDYCDCTDASDEPGTAACSNGVFHCVNRGYRSGDIPSSRVNDGICDCCDGTDEFDEKVHCSNTCIEMGRQMREEAEKMVEVLRAGFKKRQELVESIRHRKEEKAAALGSIEAQVALLEPQKDQYSKAKETAEALEKTAKDKHRDAWDAFRKERDEQRDKTAAEDAFKFLSPDQSPLSAMGLITKLTKEGENMADDLKEFLSGLGDSVVSSGDFISTVWPKVKDAYNALKPPTPGPAGDTPLPEPPAEQPAVDHTLDPYDEEEREVEEDHAYTPPDETLPPNEDRMPDYDADTLKLIAEAEKARKEYTDFDLKVFKANEEKTALKKWLENDYGPDNVFAALEGSCHEYTDREYTYKLCPFDKVQQKPKDGGSETGLGKWGNWADGFKVMMYTDGARCWNGPSRSTKVILECGAENQLGSASEPSRCEYQMVFRTPAVCTEPPQNMAAHLGLHDEL